MTLAHTIDETLGKFDLVSGGGDGETTACTLTALSWANGDAWTDNIPCAHQTLRYAVIAANDAPYTTADQRAELVRLGAPTDEREGHLRVGYPRAGIPGATRAEVGHRPSRGEPSARAGSLSFPRVTDGPGLKRVL